MVSIAGLNIADTRHGQPLQDGGCAIVEDGEVVVAVSEERITREKYAPGFRHSLDYCLEYVDQPIEDIDYFVVSNCSDRPLTQDFLDRYLEECSVDVPEDKLVINASHHLSHAASAFYGSPFDESIVLVIDNNGNVLRGDYENPKFNGLERTTAYVGRDGEIELFRRYHDDCSQLGFGAVYKYVTLYLGFESYKDAGKVMGLASYGEGELSSYHFFDDDRRSLVESRPHDPQSAVRDCLREQGFDPGPPKSTPETPSDLQIEIAWLVQRELERVLVDLIDELVDATSLTTLCYAGGVALNCVANERLRQETPLERLFIPPAPGDYGQCLGNALYGWYCHLNKERGSPITTAYLGRSYGRSTITRALSEYKDEITVTTPRDIPTYVADRLTEGSIVGVFDGRSEFGPRALGNRSIIADPRDPKMKDRVNENIKFREEYRPFAPTVLREHYDEYFDSSWELPCEYMILAQPVEIESEERIPAVTHVNETARLQTVSQSDNELFYNIIDRFYQETGVPVVLNTSFNLSGEPIVEKPVDAIDTFLRSGLDTLVLGGNVVEKDPGERERPVS